MSWLYRLTCSLNILRSLVLALPGCTEKIWVCMSTAVGGDQLRTRHSRNESIPLLTKLKPCIASIAGKGPLPSYCEPKAEIHETAHTNEIFHANVKPKNGLIVPPDTVIPASSLKSIAYGAGGCKSIGFLLLRLVSRCSMENSMIILAV